MVTSGTPTPASEWKGAEAFAGHDLELPSGNVARIKRLSPTDFLKEGTIPDPLTEIIRKAIHLKKGLNPKELEVIQDDPVKLAAALEMLDKTLCRVVIQPEVQMPPACDQPVEDGICGEYATDPVHDTPMRTGHHAYHEGARDEGVLYADVVDMHDKMFIFQWALGGTQDLKSFREELASGVESLQDGSDVQRKAKRPARSR